MPEKDFGCPVTPCWKWSPSKGLAPFGTIERMTLYSFHRFYLVVGNICMIDLPVIIYTLVSHILYWLTQAAGFLPWIFCSPCINPHDTCYLDIDKNEPLPYTKLPKEVWVSYSSWRRRGFQTCLLVIQLISKGTQDNGTKKIINLCGLDLCLFLPHCLCLLRIVNENSHTPKCWAKTKRK